MKTFESPSPVSVDLELGIGNVFFSASERGDTTVDVQPTNAAQQADVDAAAATTVEFENGGLRIASPRTWRGRAPWGSRVSIDVHIELPAGSNMRGSAAIATVRSTGRLGECVLKAGIGDLRVDEGGPVTVTVGAGDIEVGHAIGPVVVKTNGRVGIGTVDGDVVVKNSNGDTSIQEVIGDVRVSAANGGVAIERARGNVVARTANGDVRVGGTRHGSIVAKTARGKVDVGIGDGLAAWLDLNTAFGTVRNELDNAGPPANGEDAIHVRARTAFGDITIRRAHAA